MSGLMLMKNRIIYPGGHSVRPSGGKVSVKTVMENKHQMY